MIAIQTKAIVVSTLSLAGSTIRIGTCLLLLLLSGTPTPAAANVLFSELGIRLGGTDGKNEENFTLVEMFARRGFPWSWSSGRQWQLSSHLEIGLGALESAGQTGLVASLGPLVTLRNPGSRWQFELGIKPTWLSEDRFGRENLGGHFHFTSHIGVNYRYRRDLLIGYRFQHTSNASIKDVNPGLDVHLLAIDWRFD